ncbi:signal recognition particle protein Ffh [Thermoclostridium stercorarium subsp. stercorarium DSM 8532]|uniref:Signal recognition particle protein n=3 Tax=Thermoclostridium stercorarium TaxID=1510 RepID=L7VRK9_THES1|nr:signal recognition particle protein [Thermoclostridium stercorarium]AGC68188.1 signal recognition particle protein Ffh [Thermoclostridium stercorarium subsp. stercorarium DSM 8532]AGI39215.1 signal recognition particle [Thermoclostridium stercorarium subsp. stercorarium DSM 8532]ANW98560.1 signal recognition particle protein [Thermoclostridium stercorarium subsp. thermolacticum DSM 2910]ANX01098.1 signal recognition particle protein [Thermoclostridium stercorarium subsp. leptospartum DSM 921
MVFEGLSEKLQNVMKKIRSAGRVTEKDVKEMMREVRMALLEADVNYKVVKDFIAKVSERAVGQEVLESLTPGQQVIKIVHEELIQLMGGAVAKLTVSPSPPTVYMMVGLQGAGKTTVCGKLANYLRKQGKRPLLVACDVYRPAAVKQLQVLGKQIDIPVFEMGTGTSPVEIAKKSVDYARSMQFDTVIIDTAGRLHIDEELMHELENIKLSVKPHEILLVVDSMTGQDAVNVAESFNNRLDIDGIILTKLDGDTRGGAALSTKAVTGKPVKFVGIGEKLSDFEPFYPDRMASRILGMGDVLTLIEKAQASFDEKKALELEKKLRTQQFTLDDFLEQLQQIKNMGPISQFLGMLPGVNSKVLKDIQIDEKQMVYVEAIIQSMTKKERENPSIINSSRKRRIAEGSGTSIQQVNQVLKQFEQVKKMMKMFSNPRALKGLRGLGGFRLPF